MTNMSGTNQYRGHQSQRLTTPAAPHQIGCVPSLRGWLASDHGPGESTRGCGGGASPGPSVSCVVGGRNVDTAPGDVGQGWWLGGYVALGAPDGGVRIHS